MTEEASDNRRDAGEAADERKRPGSQTIADTVNGDDFRVDDAGGAEDAEDEDVDPAARERDHPRIAALGFVFEWQLLKFHITSDYCTLVSAISL